ncbi:MAG: hypothetical protein J6B75_04710 [Ruminococcus sp.]|nr:hypothetical protein [Ruminococcus sp.]
MKKIILIAVMILMFVTGCGAETSPSNSNNSNGVEAKCVALGSNFYDDGCIFGKDPAVYIDYKTMEKTVLCAKPNCTHQTSECVGKIVGECPLMYNDYLYFFRTNDGIKENGNGEREYYINSKLCRASMDSSEVEEIAGFTGYYPNDYNGYILYDNTIYFIGTDMNATPDGYGNIITSNVGGVFYLCSIDLDTKEYTNYGSIYDGDRQNEIALHTSNAVIAGYYDSKLYIDYSFGIEEVPIDRIAEIDIRDYFKQLNFEFDFKTKELVESELPEPSYLDSDTYIYSDRENKKSIVLDKGQRYELNCDTQRNASFVNNKVFVPYEKKWYDLTDMSEHSMGEYSNYYVPKYIDNCYIFALGNKIEKLTEEELLALDKE